MPHITWGSERELNSDEPRRTSLAGAVDTGERNSPIRAEFHAMNRETMVVDDAVVDPFGEGVGEVVIRGDEGRDDGDSVGKRG